MAADLQSSLRLRKRKSKDHSDTAPATTAHDSSPSHGEDVVWGKTPGGEGTATPSNCSTTNSRVFHLVFRVPTTHDVLTLFNPAYPKSHFDLASLGLLGSQIALYCILPRAASQIFFLVYFAFWRAAYDAGLGWVLSKQSKKKWIVKEIQRLGWLDEKRHPGGNDSKRAIVHP